LTDLVGPKAPFPIKLDPNAATRADTAYFQCVFYPVRLPNAALLDLRLAVQDGLSSIAGRQPNPSYFPHLSLVYGELDKESRDGLVRSVDGKGLVSIAWEVADVAVVRCAGNPEEWKIEGSVKLNGKCELGSI
jgi:Cyclic phosphodiesterase-like protein